MRPRQLFTYLRNAAMFTGYQLARFGPTTHLTRRLVNPQNVNAALLAGTRLLTNARGKTVLAISAHPDDLEFFAGGTLLRLADNGAEVHALVLSDGEKGGNHRELGVIRRKEQQRAARLIGYDSLELAGLPDDGFPEDPRVRDLIQEHWERLLPDIVFAFDPRGPAPAFINRDHTTLGKVVMRLSRKFRRLYRDLGKPPARVLFYASRHPNMIVDIEPVLGWKQRAVLCHQSQLRFLPEHAYPRLVTTYARISGAGNVQYGEAFFRLM